MESGKPVALLLRPGKTPSGVEIRTLLRHLVRRIRRHWPRTRLTFRGDSHYGRTEAMAWCEANGVDYIFGLAGNAALHGLAYDAGDDLEVRRAEAGADKIRGFASFDYAARSWRRKRRVVARLEATARGFDARYIVASLAGDPRHLYEGIYCARGQAENLIKQHKVGSARGEIETGGERDWFRVDLDAGKIYEIDLEGSVTWAGTLRDPYLYGVYNEDGTTYHNGTTDDDDGLGNNSRVTFTAPTDGAYYVVAGAYGGLTGTYTLSVAEDSM